MRMKQLTLAILASLALPAERLMAEDGDHSRLDRMTVTALPIDASSDELAQQTDILEGEVLDRRAAATIGETVARQPGVQSSYFGAAVGRPIIRGLDGARVEVLSNGLSTLDVSTVSVDHATTVEPFLADRVEILRGPSSLLYGSGAIGGVVNVVDGRVPDFLPEKAFSGRVLARGAFGTSEASIMARADARLGSNLVLHADAFRRESSDYEIPGFAEMEPEEDELRTGILENSRTRTDGGALGLSWVGSDGYFGVALSQYNNRYGLPGGHGHHHHDDDDHDHDAFPTGYANAWSVLRPLDEDDHDHDHDEDEEEIVTLDIEQTRIDVRAERKLNSAILDTARLKLAYNDYRHIEFEGDEVGTRFDSESIDARLEVAHREWNGWTGAFGLQVLDRDLVADGEEAFVPPSETQALGLFLYETRKLDWGRLELGARYDHQEVSTRDGRSADHDAINLAGGLIWNATPGLDVVARLTRSQRAPSAEELYSDGPHIATQSFEIGDADLDVETGNQLELGLRGSSERWSWSVTSFFNRFDDFIYLRDTDEEEDELPVREWTQADARFRGLEAEAKWLVADGDYGRWDLRLFADRVRATLKQGGNLPRIAPWRAGTELSWNEGPWAASVGVIRVDRQDRVAEFEEATPGHTLIEADLRLKLADLPGADWSLFFQGRNLGDRDVRAHTSPLKEQAPLPGRVLAMGIRADF